MKYYTATYGCQMNEYDTALIASMLERDGAISVDNPEEADAIIVNTCSVREKAEETAITHIGVYKPIKDDINPNLKIVVTGCMAQNRGHEIMRRLPYVNYVVGPDQYRKIPNLLFGKQKRRYELEFDREENYVGESAKIVNPYSAQIAIQRGCNKHCSYCIVPYVRGPEKYRECSDILREVKDAAGRGVTEIMLLGQTVNAYKDGNEDFASLLNRISDIDGIRRIRFTSPHPRHYTDELLRVLIENPKVCHQAHIPLQSGSNAMLKKMRRQHDMDTYFGVIDTLRSADPLYHISTDIICGFVGETDEDFEQTLEAVRRVQYDTAFMFIYSPREGTESFKETEILTEEQKKARHTRLVELQNAITLERNKLMLGRTETLLVERSSSKDDSEMLGRTDNYKKVIFPADASVKPGDYVQCKIDDIRGWTLRGTLVK